MERRVEVRVGTSGWHCQRWVGPVDPAGTKPAAIHRLYAGRFGTVEVNNSFYRLPAAETIAAWLDATPPGFLFSGKGSRSVTHVKNLTDPAAGIERLMERVAALGAKLGPVPFQFPPRWRRETDRLAAFPD